jgi:hypothetical protein
MDCENYNRVLPTVLKQKRNLFKEWEKLIDQLTAGISEYNEF